MKLGTLNAFFALVSLGILVGCASAPHPQEPIRRNQNTPLPKQGSNELKELIEEVRVEMDSPEQSNDGGRFDEPPANTYKPEIPLVVNERVEFWLNYFTERDRERFQRFLDRGEIYRGKMQAILKENGIPQEIYYLAMIESGFTIHAKSHASAVGVWQFIKPTGKRYSLQVDSYADERRDPIRATFAAAAYLRDLHNVFQSWYLAMAAYNAGESRIMGAIMRSNSRDFWELAEQRALPRETMDYVPKFIAASIIGHHPERFGFEINDGPKYPELVAKTVPSRLRLSDIARTTSVPLAELKKVNPHLLRNVTPPNKATYEIWLPATRENIFDANQLKLAKLPRATTRTYSSRGSKFHRIRRGETLGLIAKRYGTSVSSLRRLNNIRGNTIHAGSSIKVTGSTRRATASTSSRSGRVHIVRSGDTLFRISKRYNITMSYLKKLNAMRGSTVRVGQRLKLGGTSTPKVAKKYRVRRGDSLTKIARKFGTSVTAIKRLNSIRRNRIYAGQVLRMN